MHPSASFCFRLFFVFQVFTLRELPGKIQKNYIKNQRSRTYLAPEVQPGGPPGLQPPWRRAPPGPRRGGAWAPEAPLMPPFGIYLKRVAETLIPDPFSPDAILISAAIAIKLRGTRIPVPAPYRDGEVPPDSSPSTLLPPSKIGRAHV